MIKSFNIKNYGFNMKVSSATQTRLIVNSLSWDMYLVMDVHNPLLNIIDLSYVYKNDNYK